MMQPSAPDESRPCLAQRGARGSWMRSGAAALFVLGLKGCAPSSGVAPHASSPAPAEGPEVTPAERPRAVAEPEASGRPVPASPSRGCGRPVQPAGAGSVRAGDLHTPYLLTLPEGYDGTRPVPLVFAFHGRTRSHQSMHDGDASQLAAALGKKYAVAYVKSIGEGWDQPREQRDNLQVFDALYANLLRDYCIDTERVFAAGHSSGGLFSELLACQRAPRLRGIAAVAGAMARPECPGRSAALLVHGERDAVVSLSRGRAARDRFLAANGCSQRSSPLATPGCVLYSGCDPSLPVAWCEHDEPTYQDTNHGWPSFASAELVSFFDALGRVPHSRGTPLIENGDLSAGAEPWQVSFAGGARGSSAVTNGALCATLDSAGQNPWDAQLAHPGLDAEHGRTYVIDFRLWASAPTDVRVRLGLDAPPFSEYWVQNVSASTEPQRISDSLVLVDRAPGSLALNFQFAGSYALQVPVTLCIDEVAVTLLPQQTGG